MNKLKFLSYLLIIIVIILSTTFCAMQEGSSGGGGDDNEEESMITGGDDDSFWAIDTAEDFETDPNGWYQVYASLVKESDRCLI